MNLSQVFSVARWALALSVGYSAGYATAKGWANTTFIGLAASAWPLVWGILNHTDAAKLRAVEAMPDIKEIVAEPTATDGVAAAVADPTRPKIKSA